MSPTDNVFNNSIPNNQPTVNENSKNEFQFNFVGVIALNDGKVNTSFYSDDISAIQRDLYNRHKNGEITNEEYLKN